MTRRTELGRATYWAFTLVLLLALAVVARYAPAFDAAGRTIITFLAVLPLVNAIFDFLSYGLTRRLLRWGARIGGWWAFGFGLADLAAAAVLFGALGAALVALLTGYNALAAAPWVDLAALFGSIRADPEAYWWLYVMFFSTLVPTFAHLVLATTSGVLALMPERAARFVRGCFRPIVRDDRFVKNVAVVALTTIALVGLMLAILIVWALIQLVLAYHPTVGSTYLWLFETLAAWLGEPVTPVPPAWLADGFSAPRPDGGPGTAR
jgi:uncharacterized membrane protein